MWNEPTKARLASIPGLYGTEGIPTEEKIIHLHFFVAGCDWYAAEYDPEQELCFGYAILNEDYQNAEWGYFSIAELRDVTVAGWVEVDCEIEMAFPPRPAIEIEKICRAMGWKRRAPQPAAEHEVPENGSKKPRFASHYLQASNFGVFAAKEAKITGRK